MSRIIVYDFLFRFDIFENSMWMKLDIYVSINYNNEIFLINGNYFIGYNNYLNVVMEIVFRNWFLCCIILSDFCFCILFFKILLILK